MEPSHTVCSLEATGEACACGDLTRYRSWKTRRPPSRRLWFLLRETKTGTGTPRSERCHVVKWDPEGGLTSPSSIPERARHGASPREEDVDSCSRVLSADTVTLLATAA